MPFWLLLIVLSLATYRLTRLVVKDTFPPALWLRTKIVRLWNPYQGQYRPRWEWFADLVTCHWCASGWLSLGLVLGTAWGASVPSPVLVWLAVWAVAAWIANVEDRASWEKPFEVKDTTKDHAP